MFKGLALARAADVHRPLSSSRTDFSLRQFAPLGLLLPLSSHSFRTLTPTGIVFCSDLIVPVSGEKVILPGMVVSFDNLNSTSGLKKLDEYLRSRTYITGYLPSKDDICVYDELSGPPSSDYGHVLRWYKHIEALSRNGFGEGQGVKIERSTSVSKAVSTSPPIADTKASAIDDDGVFMTLFGEEIEASVATAKGIMKSFKNLRNRFRAISTVARKIEKDKVD